MGLDRAIADVMAQVEGDLQVTAWATGDEELPLAAELGLLADELAAAGVAVRHAPAQAADAPMGGPALSLGSGAGVDRIHYLALPVGPEAAPFARAVEAIARGGLAAAPKWQDALAGLDQPVDLLVLIGPTCPHCPLAVDVALQLAVASSLVNTTVVDATRFPALAERFGVKSVPATLVDGGVSFTGVVPGAQLVETILGRGSAGHARQLFRSVVTAGRHGEAGELLRSGALEHFLEWWGASVLSERIGLMLVAEEALDEEPTALHAIVPELIGLLRGEDDSLRGDTADLLGRTGHPDVRAELEALTEDENPDVAEVARDALDELEE